MPRIPLRPSVIAACLPGMAETISHPSKPSAKRQTHNKLATPDPRAFEAELIQAQEDPLGWSETLREQVRQASVVEPGLKAAPKRKHALLRPCRKAAERLGLSSGAPEPHARLLRYSSLQCERDRLADPSDRSANVALAPHAAPLLSNATQDLNGALIARLEQSNHDLAAGISRRRQAELKYAHAQTLHAAREQLALRARRAANLSDSINVLTRERAELLQQLHGCNVRTDAVSAAIHDLESNIVSARAALNALPGVRQSRAVVARTAPSAANAHQGEDPSHLQRVCTRLEHAVQDARARGDVLAKTVFSAAARHRQHRQSKHLRILMRRSINYGARMHKRAMRCGQIQQAALPTGRHLARLRRNLLQSKTEKSRHCAHDLGTTRRC